MKRIQIERRRGLSPAAFFQEHLRGPGLPVIVTDATDKWKARSTWTFEFLKAEYGSETVLVRAGLSSKISGVMDLAGYIDGLDEPSGPTPKFWLDADGHPRSEPPQAPTSPLYLVDWHVFRKHPELFAGIDPVPYFVEDWVPSLSPILRDLFQWTAQREYWDIFIGPQGSLSKLHYDFWHTHAYFAQIRGRKHCTLFSPEDTEFLYDGRVDPERPDFERFGLFDKATAYEAVLEPGEVLFVPRRWWHSVVALEKSITVSHSFFNHVNFGEHVTHLIRNLPALVEGLEKFDEWRAALDIEWRCKGFDHPDLGANPSVDHE